VGLYDSVMRNDRMCLCRMLAAEYATLPKPMQDGLRSFFERTSCGCVECSRKAPERAFHFQESANAGPRAALARSRCMLVARSYGDPGRFKSARNACLRIGIPAAREPV